MRRRRALRQSETQSTPARALCPLGLGDRQGERTLRFSPLGRRAGHCHAMCSQSQRIRSTSTTTRRLVALRLASPFFFRWNGRHGSTRMVELITDRQRSFDSVTMDPVAVAYYHMSVYAHGTSIKSECREKRRKKVLEPPYASYSYAFPQNKFLSPLQADCLENEILFYFCVFSVIFSCFLI